MCLVGNFYVHVPFTLQTLCTSFVSFLDWITSPASTYLFKEYELDQPTAKRMCRGAGSRLSAVTTYAENFFLQSAILGFDVSLSYRCVRIYIHRTGTREQVGWNVIQSSPHTKLLSDMIVIVSSASIRRNF